MNSALVNSQYFFPKFQKCQLFWHLHRLPSRTAATIQSTVASSNPSTCATSKSIRTSAAIRATKNHQNKILGKKLNFGGKN